MKPTPFLSAFLQSASIALLAASSASAAIYTWNQTVGGSQSWTTDTNWNPVAVPNPGSGDTVDFSAVDITNNTSLILEADRTAEIWKFGDTNNNKDWTVDAGNSIILAGTTPTIEVVNRTATLNNVIDGSAGLTKSGAGTLVLNGANTYTGTTTITGGILDVDTTSWGPVEAGPLSLSGGGQLKVVGGSISSASQVSVGTGGGSIWMGTNNATFTTTGKLTGSGTLTVTGSINRYFSFNSQANDFTGGINILPGYTTKVTVNSLADSANNIAFNNSGAQFIYGTGATAPLTFSPTGRAFDISSSGTTSPTISNTNTTQPIIINTNLVATGGGAKTLKLSAVEGPTNVFAGDITDATDAGTGTVALSKSGGVWALGGTNTYTGTTTTNGVVANTAITSGTLIFQGLQSLPDDSTIYTEDYSSANGVPRFLHDDDVTKNVSILKLIRAGGAMNLEVGNNSTGNGGSNPSSTSTGKTITIGSLSYLSSTTGNSQSITGVSNVTPADGYRLKINGVNLWNLKVGTSTRTSNWTVTFNPTTAPLTLAETITQADGALENSGSAVLDLGGTAADNLITGNITNAADFDLYVSSGGTSGNEFAKPLSVVKSNTSEWTLSGTNTYTGTTSITGGLLRVTGALNGAGAVTVSNMSTNSGYLGGTGSVAAAVTLNGTGGTDLRDGSVGTLALGSDLTINGAAGANALCFDLGNGAGGTDKITVAGNVAMTNSGAGVITLNQLSGTKINPGTYDLIEATGTMPAATDFTLANTSSFGNTYALQLDGTSKILQLVVTAAPSAESPLFWFGATDNNWSSIGNWTTDAGGTTSATGAPAYNTDVSFYATGATRLTSGVLDTDFDINSLNYTTDSLSNTTIGGSKLLTLEAASGSGITVATPTPTELNPNPTPTHTISSKVGLATDQTWTVNSGGTLTVSGVVSDFGAGHSLTKGGDGTLRLSGINTYSGATIVTGGTLIMRDPTNGGLPGPLGQSSSDPANLVLGDGATLKVESGGYPATDRGFTILGTATIVGTTQPSYYLNYPLSPAYGTPNQARTLILDAPANKTNVLKASIANNGTGAVSLIKNGTGPWYLGGTCSYTGGTTINAGALYMSKVNALPSTGAVTLADVAGASLVLSNNSQTIGSLAGGGSTGGSVNLGSGTLTVGNANSTIYSANIIGTGGLIKQGSGTLELQGANTYTGATTVTAGTLALTGGSEASPITVQSGAKLGLSPNTGSPPTATTTSTAALTLDAGHGIKIIGSVDNSSSYLLMTASSISGTPTLDPAVPNYTLALANGNTELWLNYTGGGGGTAYQNWATGNEPFDGDANGDGVKDGLAFLLGAANPSENAIGRLPTVTQSGGTLILNFNCLPIAARGTATLKVAHSNTLASWTATVDQVPDADDATPDNDVTFVVDTVSEAPLNKVTATIGSAAAAGGKLFGRLEASQP